MSFILDALKKSENDRQQQSNTEFAALPTSSKTTNVPRWLWVIGILLAINLAVLIGLLLRPDTNPTPVATLTENIAADSQRATPAPAPSSGFEEQVTTAQANPPQLQAVAAATEPEELPATLVKPVLISQNPSAIPAADLYPSIHEVRASGNINLPELHLDIHVYNTEPEDRFVFINMAKLREGATLAEGPVVSEITPHGVLLRHHGQSFLLPRD